MLREAALLPASPRAGRGRRGSTQPGKAPAPAHGCRQLSGSTCPGTAGQGLDREKMQSARNTLLQWVFAATPHVLQRDAARPPSPGRLVPGVTRRWGQRRWQSCPPHKPQEELPGKVPGFARPLLPARCVARCHWVQVSTACKGRRKAGHPLAQQKPKGKGSSLCHEGKPPAPQADQRGTRVPGKTCRAGSLLPGHYCSGHGASFTHLHM